MRSVRVSRPPRTLEEETTMKPRMRSIAVAVAGLALLASCATSPPGPAGMTFFVTSAGPGQGGNLGGLEGADAHCQKLAAAVGAGGRTWKAYLSGTENGKPVNAKDRIGPGPWFNAKGVQIAANVAELHSEAAKTGKEGSLNEKGGVVNGRGDTPNTH